MARLDDTAKNTIRAEIRQHLEAHGGEDLAYVSAKHPEISRATFYRFVAEVRRDMEARGVREGNVREVRKAIKARPPRAEMSARELVKHLPATPTPEVVAGADPVMARQAFDFMRYFHLIVADADLVRDALIITTTDADGKTVTKVKNPVLMDKSIGRRLSIIQNWLNSQELIYNYERMREMYAVIVDAVGRADSETQAVILAELRELNAKRGITLESVLGGT